MTEVEAFTDPGETTNKKTNEDFIWNGTEDGVKAFLLLDGTSGTKEDFGSGKEKTGGRIYVESIGESVERQLKDRPEKDLGEVMKEAVRDAWKAFERKGVENRKKYFSGDNSTFPEATTIPGAVGTILKWNDEYVEIFHVGDVEAYIVLEDGVEFFSNSVHRRFDEIMNEKITEFRNEGVENPEERPEVLELRDKHRAASNLPGTYPQLMFNPLAVEKQGVKKRYRREKVEKAVLGSDGATTRMRELFDFDEKELIEFIEEKGAENAVKALREKEDDVELDELKNSDDAAVGVIKF